MRVLLAVALVIAGFGSTGARVRALTTDADDFAIPAGWFFTEASPDHASGTGFAVQDGHAADLWRAFQAAGGVSVLGYPMSRRFEWDGLVAQAFSSGDTLRWNPDTGEPEVLSTSDLPEGKPPEYALVPDKPPVVSADVQPTPWSGWWWPATGAGPSLFAPNGPLDKYDQYVSAATGNARTHAPGSKKICTSLLPRGPAIAMGPPPRHSSSPSQLDLSLHWESRSRLPT